MAIRKQCIESNCPRCYTLDEYATHVLQCQQEDICNLRSDILEELNIWLCSVDTQPYINTFLYHGVVSWLDQGSHPFELDTSLHPSFLEPSDIR